MRGAVSVALVYYYYDTEGSEEPNRHHATLISMTLTVVLISTLAFGAVTKPLLDYMLGSETGMCVCGLRGGGVCVQRGHLERRSSCVIARGGP